MKAACLSVCFCGALALFSKALGGMLKGDKETEIFITVRIVEGSASPRA